MCFSTTLMTGLGTILKFSQHGTKPSHTTFLDRSIDFSVFSGCGAIGFLALYALQSGTVNETVLANTSVLGFFDGLFFAVGGTEVFQTDSHIRPAETVTWSWQAVKTDLVGNIKRGGRRSYLILIIVAAMMTCISAFFHGIGY